jgi:dihydrofolate reductase
VSVRVLVLVPVRLDRLRAPRQPRMPVRSTHVVAVHEPSVAVRELPAHDRTVAPTRATLLLPGAPGLCRGRCEDRLMGNLIASMSISLDGYIAGPDGSFDWGAPDDELHRFHNERVRDLGAEILGRRLYETMLYWETAAEDPALSDTAREFADIWLPLRKVVFSTTLSAVEGANTRLATRGVAEELESLKAETDGDIGIGGAGITAAFTELGLVDEYQLFVCPVAVGGGTPFFSPGQRVDLELIDTQTFGSRVVYLRYAAAQM